MNERIKELLAKHIASPALAVTRNLENQHTAHVTYTVSQAEMNTLLSAVVHECIDICLRNHINNIETISAGECAYDIQEHFGVEG